MRSTSAIAAAAASRARTSSAAKNRSSLSDAIARNGVRTSGIAVECSRAKRVGISERLGNASENPPRRERQQVRRAPAAESPIRFLAIIIDAQIDAPSVGKRLGDADAHGERTERGQAC